MLVDAIMEFVVACLALYVTAPLWAPVVGFVINIVRAARGR